MTDDLERLRHLRPDRLLPDDPVDPQILAREKDRLMSTITGTEAATGSRSTPSIYPRLAYQDERAALEFLTRAFGFRERREARMEHPTGMLAWLEVGDGVVMIGRAGEDLHGLHSPQESGQTTVMVNVYVDNVDAHYQKAKSEGARIVMDLEDMFWGDRRYEALDPEGHRWHFGERLSHIRVRKADAGQKARDPQMSEVNQEEMMSALEQAEPTVPNPPSGSPRILAHLIYDDVGSAIGWLTEVFGFRERTAARHVAADGTIGRTQMEVADSLITIGEPSIHGESPRRGVSSMLYIYVDDVDAHYRQTQAAGASIVMEVDDRPWGDRCYQITDPEGHQWTFAQHISDVDVGHDR
jgi:PhnB protein